MGEDVVDSSLNRLWPMTDMEVLEAREARGGVAAREVAGKVEFLPGGGTVKKRFEVSLRCVKVGRVHGFPNESAEVCEVVGDGEVSSSLHELCFVVES